MPPEPTENWIDDIEWDDLITNISKKECVLIVGPDIVNWKDANNFFQLLISHLHQADKKIRKNLELSTSFVFEHDELLQLQPEGRDTSLYGFLEGFYKDRNE